MNLSEALHPPPGDDDADHGVVHRVRHFRLPAARGRGAAAGRLPDHPGHGARCRAPARRPWRPRSRPDRAAVLDHRRHHVDDLDVDARARPRSPSSSTSTATSTARRSTCRPRFGRAAPAAGRNDHAAVVPQGQSGRLPGPVHQPRSRRRCRCRRVNEYAETVLAQQISQIPGVAQVLVYGSQKFAVRVQVDPVAAAARNISLDDIRNAVSQGQFQHAGRHAGGAAAEHHAAGVRRDDEGRGLSDDRGRPGATARRSSSNEIADVHRQRRERQGRELVQQRARHRAGDPAPARRQHRRGGRRGARASCRSSARRCRRRSSMEVAARPLDLDPRMRSPTCRTRWRSPLRWWCW